MGFLLALSAGHGINTVGKYVPSYLDPKNTREWVYNDRIADYVEKEMLTYRDVAVLRLDDSDDGEENVALSVRVNMTNAAGADFFLSLHHNAGIDGGDGGGIVAYIAPNASEASKEWQKLLYDAIIAETGLKGNRATPLAVANFQVLRDTRMPAVLLELGFMDSRTDYPIIITDTYARQCAKAIVETIVKREGLVKKEEAALEPVETAEFVRFSILLGNITDREEAERINQVVGGHGVAGVTADGKVGALV